MVIDFDNRNNGGGGKEPVVESLSVTTNGTYNAPSGVDGYNPVEVNVPEKTFNKASVTKEYTENGQYSIATPDGYDGISDVSVNVNVASSGGGGKFGAGLSGMKIRTNAQTIDLSNLDTSAFTDMSEMFSGCSSLTSIDLSSFDTSNVVKINDMFYGCSSLTSLDLSSFNTSKVGNLDGMFEFCEKLETVDMSSFDIRRYDVQDIGLMFRGCTSLTNIKLGDNFDTIFVQRMNYMFSGCSSLTSIDFNLAMNSCTTADHMFADCGNLDHIYFVGWNFQQIKNLNSFLLNCSKLNQIDISDVDWSTATSLTDMFRGCTSLTRIQCQGLKLPDADMSNIGLDSCPLNKYNDLDDLVGLLNALPQSTHNYSFQIGQTNIAKLSPVQKQIATDKGWTLV